MRRYFINGLLVLLPGIITVYVLVVSLVTIDGFLGNIVAKLVGFHIPGIGAVLTVLLILGTGIFTTNIVGRKIFQWGERLLLSIPILKNIYLGVGQLVKAFSSTAETQRFQRVVLIEYPRAGCYALGFVTNEDIPEFNTTVRQHTITIFVPTTPNPTSGILVIIPEKDCIPLDISVEDAFKTIISAGIVGPAGNS